MTIPKKLSREIIDNILRKHEVWLKTRRKDGEKADFTGANLSKVNFSGKNISGADFNRAILSNANFSKSELVACDFSSAQLDSANFSEADLFLSDLSWSNLEGANFRDADLHAVDLEGALLDGAFVTQGQLSGANNVSKKYLVQEKENIEANAKARIEVLENKIKAQQDKLTQLSTENKNELERAIAQNEADKKRLQDSLEKERTNKEVTRKQIERAIEYLKKPNSYIKNQILIQYALALFCFSLIILLSFTIKSYIDENYTSFLSKIEQKSEMVLWLTYTSPLILGFSLIITLISQINNRIKKVMELFERKRYVESIGGGMNAILELMNANIARERIMEIIDELILKTIDKEKNSEEKQEKKDVEKPQSILSKLKEAKELL